MKIPNAVTLKVLVESYYAGFFASEVTSDSLDSAVRFLCDQGLISAGNISGQPLMFHTTEKGDFFVEQLLQVNLPEARQVWVIPT